MSGEAYTTVRVAKLLGIASGTFHRWIREKRIEAPPVQNVFGTRVRVWSENDIEAARKYKTEHYWGKGGRKKHKKRTN
jgi:excisionase family DNA binding protein